MTKRVQVAFPTTTLEWFLERLDLDGAEWRGKRDVLVRCPSHADFSPSLHLWEDKLGLGVHCFAGCERSEIEDALQGEIPQRVKPPRVFVRRTRGSVVARYDYRNAEGEIAFRKLRFDPKSFEFRRPVVVAAREEGPVQHSEYVKWVRGLKDSDGQMLVEPIPYNLPELVTTGMPWVVDGEKDADRLAAEGVVATCSPYGMKGWRPEWDRYLADFPGRGGRRSCTIVADRDEAGRRAAQALASRLLGVFEVRVVEAVTGKDAYDHLEAGYGLEDFMEVG